MNSFRFLQYLRLRSWHCRCVPCGALTTNKVLMSGCLPLYRGTNCHTASVWSHNSKMLLLRRAVVDQIVRRIWTLTYFRTRLRSEIHLRLSAECLRAHSHFHWDSWGIWDCPPSCWGAPAGMVTLSILSCAAHQILVWCTRGWGKNP